MTEKSEQKETERSEGRSLIISNINGWDLVAALAVKQQRERL
jgi:hypothetical protein